MILPSGSWAAYAELGVTSNFTFLAGASHPDELVVRAAELGYRAIALADTNTLGGIVRAHVAAKEVGIPLIVGCRLVLADPPDLSVRVYPTDLAAYGRLCRLLTRGKLRTPKGQCRLTLEDLLEHQEGLLAVATPEIPLSAENINEDHLDALRTLRRVFDRDRLSIAAACPYGPDDRGRLIRIAELCRRIQAPMVATNDAHYHEPGRRMLQDVLTCIRHGCTLETAGYRLLPHSERHLKGPEEMARLFADYPHAIRRTIEIAERCGGFSLDQLRYEYPSELVPPGTTPMDHLAGLARAGARERFPEGMPRHVRHQFEHELKLIDELGYAHYILTTCDLVRHARSEGILCQGRGAAANSVVCYCLHVTDADPRRINTLFERFVSRDRGEPPDIDIDFEHERREVAIQYLYRKYGRDRAALCAEVVTYRGRLAVREVGKALGLSLDCVDRLAKGIDWWSGQAVEPHQLKELRLDPDDPAIGHLIRLSEQIRGFPRHRSQHVGGFVITHTPLCELVPIENAGMPDRTVIEWDKDDIEALGMIKVDVLGLGMLTVLRRGFDLVERHHGRTLTIGSLPEDEAVYDMICAADTVGVFQIESRAQMSMLPRLRPRCYYDLVVEVAIVRPGPIQGQMVHPYLRRRQGLEDVSYPDQTVQEILGRTLGVPLFQEQAMTLAIRCAGFTPDEADRLRRAVTGFRNVSNIESFERRFVGGMLHRGYQLEFARRCFEQIRGFATYGFPESHSASFALLAYASAYLKCHYPAAFTAALLNSQPMGFYAPAQLVQDAQRHGVKVHPVDIHRSDWDCTLEDEGRALRLGFSRVRGLRESDARRIVETVRRHGTIRSIETLWRASGVRAASLVQLAAADAFGSMGMDRQSALWHARRLKDEPAPLFDQPRVRAAAPPDGVVRLPKLPELRHVIHDHRATGVSLRPHPVSFLRAHLRRRGVLTAADLLDVPQGRRVAVAGLCICRQRPGTAGGVTFMTIADETGTANLVVRPAVWDRHRSVARHARALLACGRIDRSGEVIHIIAGRFESLDDHLQELRSQARDFR